MKLLFTIEGELTADHRQNRVLADAEDLLGEFIASMDAKHPGLALTASVRAVRAKKEAA